jgi:predicted metal-dependent phosphotriesterase family hydrolase
MKNRKYLSIVIVVLMMFSLVNNICESSYVKAEETNSKHVINIVWDGLSNDMFNNLKQAGLETPNIDYLIENGRYYLACF